MKKLMAAVLVTHDRSRRAATGVCVLEIRRAHRREHRRCALDTVAHPLLRHRARHGTSAGAGACWRRDARLCDVAERLNGDGSRASFRGRRSFPRDFRTAGRRLASSIGRTWTVCSARPVFCSMPGRARSSKPTSSSTRGSRGRRRRPANQVVSISNPWRLHEIGHLLGLGHSALGETEMLAGGGRRVVGSGAVMFPIAMSPGAVADRILQPDDVAGISDLYPTAAFRDATGSISGTVTKDARGVFGAHVAAFNIETGDHHRQLHAQRSRRVCHRRTTRRCLRRPRRTARRCRRGGVSSPAPIDVNFQVAYATRAVVVSQGGGAGPVTIVVKPK